MKKFSFRLVWIALKDAFKHCGDDKITKLSASLAYYTVFSLGPMLIVIVSVTGLIMGREAVQGTLDNQIQDLVGADAARQIQDILRNAAISGKGVMATVIGVITLLIGASGVFAEIQDSINSIWGLKPRPKVGFMKLIKTRLLSFGIIGTLGFLLLVSLAVTALVEGLNERLKSMFPEVTVILFYIVNLLITLSVITAIFMVIFKVLPDAKIRWKAVLPGAIATALLFMVGKFAISFYISKSDIGSTFGAAGSLVVLLVWVYYSAIILYFGAEFTKSFALAEGARIEPNHYAQWAEKPTVPGAAKKIPPAGGRESGRRREAPQPYMAMTRQSKPASKPKASRVKDKGPGMGSTLLGLALYFFNRDRRPKS